MAYRLRYQAFVDWIPPGRGLGIDAQVSNMPGMNGGPAQTIGFFDISNPVSTTFTSTDVTALLATMSADLSAQMSTTANLARITAFSSGGS